MLLLSHCRLPAPRGRSSCTRAFPRLRESSVARCFRNIVYVRESSSGIDGESKSRRKKHLKRGLKRPRVQSHSCMVYGLSTRRRGPEPENPVPSRQSLKLPYTFLLQTDDSHMSRAQIPLAYIHATILRPASNDRLFLLAEAICGQGSGMGQSITVGTERTQPKHQRGNTCMDPTLPG